MYPPPILKLIDEFAKMPGIGKKSAGRLAFYIMSLPRNEAEALTGAILDAKNSIKLCPVCQGFTDREPCTVCASEKRDKSVICVVEGPRDVEAMEKTHEYNGLYHVLHGVISPIDGIGPEDIKVRELLGRITENNITEIIMATNPSVEGEATAMYIAKLLAPFGIKITRIARGIPVGGDLEYTDEITLARALDGRREMSV